MKVGAGHLPLPPIGFGRSGHLAYACDAAASRGRLFDEQQSPTRTPFQRDRDRIIHSAAFRRLKHKTQVFVYHEGDYYRTRLTHSIEVAQIARAFARAFRVDEDLAEAVALVHDFGHPPFGHAGERALNQCMRDYGGFDHNAQSLRVVTMLERRYAEFDGLNLCWETLDGLVKHNGPFDPQSGVVPASILRFNALFDLELNSHSSIEAQAAAIADDIAYNAHDLDDALRAGLFVLDAIADVPLLGELLAEVRAIYPGLDVHRTQHEVVRRQITLMVEDVIRATAANIKAAGVKSNRDVRDAGTTLVGFSPQMAEYERAIKKFLFKNMYRAPSVNRVTDRATIIVQDLFAAYLGGEEMAEAWNLDWARGNKSAAGARRAEMVADFLAGMTDRQAILEHNRLFDHTPELR